MTTKRGVRFDFEPGECVLCFEPDPTKAKVLYNAKVLDLVSSRDRNGRRRPEYHVHFQGWNSSWDRIVPESFILKNDTENRNLMTRLTEIAKRRNKSRLRKIDNILKEHFKKKPSFDSDSSEVSADSTEENNDNDDDDDDDDNDDDDDDDDDSGDDDTDTETLSDRHQSDSRAESDSEDDVSPSNGVEDLDAPVKPVHVDLPQSLKTKLEDDCYLINRKNKLVRLPADPNVITLLEGYVKNFAINILCATTEKHKPYTLRETQVQLPEKSVDLCKEVMDGLRVLFDFALPTLLLYSGEHDQYERLAGPGAPRATNHQQPGAEIHKVQSARMRSGGGGGGEDPGAAPRSPPAKAARLSPRVVKREPVDDGWSDDDDGPPRRITRKAFAEEVRRSKEARAARAALASTSDGSATAAAAAAQGANGGDGGAKAGRRAYHDAGPRGQQPQAETPSGSGRHHIRGVGSSERKSRRRDSLRSTRARSTSGMSSDSGKGTSAADRQGSHRGGGGGGGPPASGSASASASGVPMRLEDRVSPPPRIQIAQCVSSRSSSEDTPTSSLLEHVIFRKREAAVNDVFSWSMVPEAVYQQVPPPPSLVYGSHHLTRLFVKLPALLGKMRIPDVPLKSLLKHLDQFIEYVSDRGEEFFADSTYMDSCDLELANGKPPSGKH